VHAPSEGKNDVAKDSFYEELEQFFLIISVSTIQKFYDEILMQKWGEKIFSNQQLGMRFYVSILMIMV